MAQSPYLTQNPHMVVAGQYAAKEVRPTLNYRLKPATENPGLGTPNAEAPSNLEVRSGIMMLCKGAALTFRGRGV